MPFPELPQMGEIASAMLRSALDAFTAGDAAAARATIARDAEINELYERAFGDLLKLMTTDATATGRAARLIFVAKHLERVGDYVTDICELTVYMTEAAFIKHGN
jgi:phosphate transport system protein